MEGVSGDLRLRRIVSVRRPRTLYHPRFPTLFSHLPPSVRLTHPPPPRFAYGRRESAPKNLQEITAVYQRVLSSLGHLICPKKGRRKRERGSFGVLHPNAQINLLRVKISFPLHYYQFLLHVLIKKSEI